MNRTFWIYQRKTENKYPWAICIEKEWKKGKPRDCSLSINIFSEMIDTPTYSRSFYNLELDKEKYLELLENTLREYGVVSDIDRKLLENRLTEILNCDKAY